MKLSTCRKLLSLGAALALPACAAPAYPPAPAPAPAPAPREATAPAAARGVATITPGDMYSRIAYLASDALRGRDTPSPGLDAAAAYLVDQYRRLEMEPAGERESYYQWYPFPLRQVDAAGVRLEATTPRGRLSFAPGRDFYAAGGTPGNLAAPPVFVGTAPDPLMAEGALRERIAVAVLPGAYSREWRLELRRQLRAARRAGASALVHLLDAPWTADSIAKYAAAAGRPQRVLGGEAGYPQLFLGQEAARRLFAAGGVDFGGAWREAVAGTAKGTPLAGVTLTAGIPQREVERAMAPNVVAVLRGSDPVLRDEYVVLSAHMDHVGVGRPVNGDSIYNGADDDASGTAALVEVAEALASLPVRPRRSIVFLHVSGEEKGLLGSQWYSDHPTVPLAQVVANVNVDMIARNARDSVVVIGKDYSTLGQVVNAVRERHPELGLVAADDLWPEESFFFRSDHFNFARKEIPAIFFFSGVHPDYHRPSDEVEKIDADKAARVARYIFHTVVDIANAAERPRWDPRGLEEVRRLTR
jgi:hypothetical protein